GAYAVRLPARVPRRLRGRPAGRRRPAAGRGRPRRRLRRPKPLQPLLQGVGRHDPRRLPPPPGGPTLTAVQPARSVQDAAPVPRLGSRGPAQPGFSHGDRPMATRRLFLLLFLSVIAGMAATALPRAPGAEPKRADYGNVVKQLQRDVPKLLKDNGVPG